MQNTYNKIKKKKEKEREKIILYIRYVLLLLQHVELEHVAVYKSIWNMQSWASIENQSTK